MRLIDGLGGPPVQRGHLALRDGKFHGLLWLMVTVGLLFAHATNNLIIIQRHPQLGQLTATCSYAPDFFPIWGNQNTFSWEPYLERTIAGGQQLSWRIDYDF